jgi:threonine/homoserine/homoserine lactone efflux protein
MLDPFVQGLILGLVVSMPIGPIGVLCIQRSLDRSWFHGFCAGLGATAADLIYAVMAAFGVSLVSDFLVEHALWFRIPAAALLFFLGVRALQAARSSPEEAGSLGSRRGIFIATFILMLSNPLTFVAFTAVFAALGGASTVSGTGSRLVLVAGVAGGCLAWWASLAGFATTLRSRMKAAGFLWVNRISGLVLIAFAAWLLFGQS